MKSLRPKDVKKFTDIPNIGKRMAEDFRMIGIGSPEELKDKDAFILYKKLCEKTGTRLDPCVLDTFLAAVDFMNGAPARPWWHYTAERKKKFPNI